MDFEAEIRRRVTLLEEDAKGEKTVSRHILRKVNQMHDDLLGLRDEIAKVRSDLSSEIIRCEKGRFFVAGGIGALARRSSRHYR